MKAALLKEVPKEKDNADKDDAKKEDGKVPVMLKIFHRFFHLKTNEFFPEKGTISTRKV